MKKQVSEPIDLFHYKKYWDSRVFDKQEDDWLRLIKEKVKPENLLLPGVYFYYIFDFSALASPYIGGAIEQMLPAKRADLLFQKIDALIEFIHPDDRPYVLAGWRSYLIIFHATPPERRSLIKPSLTFRLQNTDGGYSQVLHQSVVIQNDNNGNVLYTLEFITDISHLKVDTGVVLSIADYNDEQEQLFESHRISDKLFHLTKRQLEVLCLLASGYTLKQIAHHLNNSYHTIETHRKMILKKMEVQSTTEAVSIALKNKMI